MKRTQTDPSTYWVPFRISYRLQMRSVEHYDNYSFAIHQYLIVIACQIEVHYYVKKYPAF